MIKIRNFRDLTPDEILDRADPGGEDVRQAVADIIADVRRRGDAALREYTKRFNGAEVSAFKVPDEALEAAFDSLDEHFQETLHLASDNIERFHQQQLPRDFVLADRPGIVQGMRCTPVERVGICVPRSPEAFPSTILMNVIPALLAGVRHIAIVTPPDREGNISPEALAAVYVTADPAVVSVYKVGGAQGVAALAYGTESIPAVDKIVGPGGVYVTEAKRQVYGRVGIDMVAGPSEILVLADGDSNPVHVAADMLSQAEHDVHAAAVLVTDSRSLAEAVQRELEVQLSALPRAETARASLENNGKILLTDSLTEAAEAANRLAPEHLELSVAAPFALLPRIRNAGSVFLGRSAPEALGDYFAGPNHTLPTSGTARFSSPLGVYDFMKRSSFLYYAPEALAGVADRIADFAEREGLHGHARSVLVRKENQEKEA